MVFDLVVETVFYVLLDRRDDRRWYHVACLVLGIAVLVVGVWTTLSAHRGIGALVAFAGSLLVLYGQ